MTQTRSTITPTFYPRLRKCQQEGENVPPDIDALFEEVDGASGASSRPFDIEAYRREAQQRAEKEVDAPTSSFPRHAIHSSSPPPGGADGDKDEEGEEREGQEGQTGNSKDRRNAPPR